MNGEELPLHRLRRVLPHEWGRVASPPASPGTSHKWGRVAPSPAFGRYFPMNGEELARLEHLLHDRAWFFGLLGSVGLAKRHRPLDVEVDPRLERRSPSQHAKRQL